MVQATDTAPTTGKTAACAYCDLPVAVRASSSSAGDENSQSPPVYCCYGCRFAHAVAQEKGVEGQVRWTVIRLGLAIFFTMNLMAFTMTMWSLNVYDIDPDPFQLKLFEVFRWLSMLFALPVLLLLGVPFISSGFRSWKQGTLSTDALIGVAVAAAYITSVVNLLREAGPIYFEVGAMVLVMTTLGRWIEAAGRQKATAALDQLSALLPERAVRVAGGQTRNSHIDGPQEVDACEIATGDLLQIRAGERFPTDGVIRTGSTSVDEQVFTGESFPIQKLPGDDVLAGTVNIDGNIIVEVSALFRQGSFGRLMDALKAARISQGYYQRLADRVANVFLPMVLLIAGGTFIFYSTTGVGPAIQTALSVLLIACPCALGLATPLAVWTALSTAVRHQVLFRSGTAIERLAGTKVICLDKTGTLTTGDPHVIQVAAFGIPSDSATENAASGIDGNHAPNNLPLAYVAPSQQSLQIQLRRAFGIAQASNHPFSKAVVAHCRSAFGSDPRALQKSFSPQQPGVSEESLNDIHTVAGGGVEGFLADGTRLRLGSLEFACCQDRDPDFHGSATEFGNSDLPSDCAANSTECLASQFCGKTSSPENPELCVTCSASVPLERRVQLDRLRMAADQMGASMVLMTVGKIPTVGFLIAETVRHEAQTAIRHMRETVGALHVLSGDRPAKTEQLRLKLNLKRSEVESKLSPEQKAVRIAEIRRTQGTTVMVGDGINDAPALAASDIGIAMGCGADVSRDSAQVCLLSNDLGRIPWAIRLARRTTAIIRQNLFWAFGYNAIGICLAVAGILNPAVAAAMMIGSSLFVIGNSLRLLQDNADPDRSTAAPPPSKDGSDCRTATDAADIALGQGLRPSSDTEQLPLKQSREPAWTH